MMTEIKPTEIVPRAGFVSMRWTEIHTSPITSAEEFRQTEQTHITVCY
jgi:hypothetical protein